MGSINFVFQNNYDNYIMMNANMNEPILLFSMVYSHYHYDVGRDTGITVSKHNSRVGGYNIGVVKGKEIAQEVCFIKLTTNFSNEPLRAIFDLM